MHSNSFINSIDAINFILFLQFWQFHQFLLILIPSLISLIAIIPSVANSPNQTSQKNQKKWYLLSTGLSTAVRGYWSFISFYSRVLSPQGRFKHWQKKDTACKHFSRLPVLTFATILTCDSTYLFCSIPMHCNLSRWPSGSNSSVNLSAIPLLSSDLSIRLITFSHNFHAIIPLIPPVPSIPQFQVHQFHWLYNFHQIQQVHHYH